jgi:hypothetical protein
VSPELLFVIILLISTLPIFFVLTQCFLVYTYIVITRQVSLRATACAIRAFTYYIYSALVIAPPSKQVSGIDALSCGTPDNNGSVNCMAKTIGTFISKLDFGSTIGKFYGRLWSPPYFIYENDTYDCYGSNTPMVTGSDTRYEQPEFVLDVPAQSISCPITVVPATDGPSKPSVSTGACTLGSPLTLSFSSTDPGGHQLKYGVDWDADGSVDQWVPPSGYVDTGTSQNASRTYTIAGQKTVKVLAQNDQGAVSSSATYTFNCSTNSCPIGYTLQGSACIFSACPSGHHLQGTQCVADGGACTPGAYCQGNDLKDNCTGEGIEACAWGCYSGRCNPVPSPNATLKAVPSLVKQDKTTVVSWSAQYATACTVSGTNGDSWTGLSGSKTSSPIRSQTTYTLNCTGHEGADPETVQKQAIVNIAPTFEEK